tara:strand:- start:410 stop:1579 length:1170 start_codon:yes stop_codon:yes gene_type:complete
MSGSVKLTQKMLNTWLEAAWRDGFTKGVDGEDSLPDFMALDPRGPEDGKKLSAKEAESADFNTCKCAARMFREGCGVQCTRKPFEGGLLCKTHQNKLDGQGSQFDLPFGWFNKERPTHHLDEKDHGKPIAWNDLKKSKSSTKKRATAKEMREQLTEMGISIDGLKGKALTLKYNEVMDSKDSSDTDSGSDSVSESGSDTVSDTVSEIPTQPQATHTVLEQSQEQAQDEEKVDSEQEQAQEQQVDEEKVDQEQEDEESSDPAAGTGLVKSESSDVPATTAEFKKYFQDLGISTEGLRGKKAFKDKYDEYQKSKESPVDDEETEDMSDDELEKDTSSFVEVDYEGVEYLEDEETSNIYNASHQLVGKWNEDGDKILWSSDSFRVAHDTMKD